MIAWITTNWGFIAGMGAVMLGGLKAYYEIEKQIALLQQSMSKEFDDIREDIKRLEKKQDKYNTLQERTLRNEMEIKHLRERECK